MKNIFKKIIPALAAIICALLVGGVAYGITPYSIFQGGTGASTASGARSNLGLGAIATYGVGTLTNTKYCTYSTTSGFVCNSEGSGSMTYPGAGIAVSTGSEWATSIATSTYNNTNWDTAYGWGNHASAGYATSTITGNAGTATALAANGANCSAGQAPLGVDASGAVENCFAVITSETDPIFIAASSTFYDSLSDLQGAVSNDFHNLGGTDANTTYTGGDFITLTGTDFDVDATSTIANGDTAYLASADVIYDFVMGRGFLTSLAGAVLTDQTSGQTIGADGARLTKLWATDITATNAIAGSITGNAGTASALAADPADCAAGTAATAIAASGALTCGITPLVSGGTLTSANVCQYDGTGIDCNLTTDGSGACGAGAVCTGGHTHVGVNETYGSGWNGDTATPEKDDVYDWGHLFDTDDDGDVDVINDGAVGIADLASVDFGGFTCNGVACAIDQNAGTDITADLEEEAHAAEHAVSAADTVFPADPNADRYLQWDDDPGALVWAAGAGGLASTDIDTSAELYGILTDETGSASGTPLLVFNTNPVLTGATLAGILADNDDMVFEADADNNGSNKFSFTDGASGEIASITEAGLLTVADDIVITGSDLSVGAAGVKLTGDGDGALTLLGMGNGYDEDITFNLDDTENTLVLSSSTGLATIDIGTMALEIDEGKLTDSTIVSADVKDNTLTAADMADSLDFGGDTSFEIPNAASPTVDAAGEIAIDTTSDQLIYYGAAKRVIPYVQQKCISLETPVDADDNIPVFFPRKAITITDVYCEVDGGTSVSMTLSDGTNALEAITCDADGAEDDGSIANGTFTSLERIEFDLASTSGTNTWLAICISYVETAD